MKGINGLIYLWLEEWSKLTKALTLLLNTDIVSGWTSIDMGSILRTRRSGHYAPILPAPAGPARGLRPPVGLQYPNFEKLEICVTLIAISCYLEAKFDYGYFIIFLPYGSKILHKKIQVISSKTKAVMLIFPIQNEIKIQENCRHAFIFAQNDLKFFV